MSVLPGDADTTAVVAPGPDIAREKLGELLATYGRTIMDDPRRFEALLRDLCGENRREAHLLVSALKERIPTDLLAAANGVPKSLRLAQLARRLHDHLGIAPSFALWAVETWALVLGVIDAKDLTSSSPALVSPPLAPPQPPLPGASLGPTLMVAPSGAAYQSIGDAVRDALPNARILVHPGHYHENILLDKPLEIVGIGLAGQVILEGDGAACLLATASEAAVRGLTLQRRGGGTVGAAVDVTRGRLVLDDCIVTAQGRAGVAVGGRNTTLIARRCDIRDGSHTGVLFYSDASGVLEDCDIDLNAVNGVHVTQGANPLVRRCKVRGGREIGVLVDEGGRGVFEDCDVVDNQFQGVLVTGGETMLQRCRVQRNLYGVWVERGGAATVEGCTLTLNREGAWRIKAGATVRQRDNRV